MTRTKSRQNTDICADCGAPDPSWASVNKGILLCIECCSIHRSLGRHISLVKSLQKSSWSNSQLSMVHMLNNAGINTLWEYTLESSPKFAKRKPTPKDSLHSKAEFIRAKHQQYAFVYRPNSEDGRLCVENELGKELHANVRSTNLEASLRFLIQGADPNYFHAEKGSTPLHAAAKANQLLQAELLITYGADPTYPDAHGKTPIDYAKYSMIYMQVARAKSAVNRQQVNQELANRLIECQYEVTDKFSNYLCHRKPDHEKGVHFLIPQTSAKSDPSAVAKIQKLPNHLFEELVMDVYDEVERRETEAIWLSSADTLELNANAVPFLPVDPSLSTTRNQGRQKLGRFTTPELKSLVYDILVDTQRRQLTSEKATQINKNLSPSLRQFSTISDDEPLYDSVASDEDYAMLTSEENTSSSDKEKSPASSQGTANATVQVDGKVNDSFEKETSPTSEIYFLAKKLQDSDNTISGLKAEVNCLKSLVERLSTENQELRLRLSQPEVHPMFTARRLNGDSVAHSLDGFLFTPMEGESQDLVMTNGQVRDGKIVDVDIRLGRKVQRPSSMYETREGLKTRNWQTLKNQMKQIENSRGATQSLYAAPEKQTVMQCTEQVTKGIQQLWKCIQGPQREACVLCAEKIKLAVTHLTAAVPAVSGGEAVQRLLDSSLNLRTECCNLQAADKEGDTQKIDYYLQQVRQYAYEIAKDTKVLVTQYSAH